MNYQLENIKLAYQLKMIDFDEMVRRFKKLKRGCKPPINRVLLCCCPEWNESGYQVAKWNGDEFTYDEQPNSMFNGMVVEWALFMEAD